MLSTPLKLVRIKFCRHSRVRSVFVTAFPEGRITWFWKPEQNGPGKSQKIMSEASQNPGHQSWGPKGALGEQCLANDGAPADLIGLSQQGWDGLGI